MKDIILIETYKDQDIYYKVDSDKFTCEMVIEDSFYKTTRTKLLDVRKAIDKFTNDNKEFKPFKFFRGSINRVETIKSIRPNGYEFNATDGNSNSVFNPIKHNSWDKPYKYDSVLEAEYNELEKEWKEYKDKYDTKLKEIKSKLIPLTSDDFNF